MIDRADEAFLIGGLCVASLWGLFTALIFHCLYQALQRRRRGPNRSLYITTTAVIVLYTLATIYAALAFAELIDGLIFTEDTEERIRYFANNGSATSVIGLALYDFIFVISDGVLVWRLHIIWGRNKWVTFLALILLLAEAGGSFAAIACYSPALFDNARATRATTVFLVTSLSINCVIPFLTAARIWWMSYSIERTSRVRFPTMTSRYRIILHLILDSGLILTVAKIFELAFFLLSTEPDVTGRTNETFRVVNEMLAMIAGIVPTVIVIIVNATSASAANRDPLEPEIQTAALQFPVPAQMAERPNQPYETTDAIFAPWTPNVSLESQIDNRSSVSATPSAEDDDGASKSKR